MDVVSPMVSDPATAGGNGAVSPMFSPPMPGQAGYGSFEWMRRGYEAVDETDKLNIKVGLTPLIRGKQFSQRSLEQRHRLYAEEYGDLSVQPLNPGKREGAGREDGPAKTLRRDSRWSLGRSGRKNAH